MLTYENVSNNLSQVFLEYFLQTEIPRFQVSKFSGFDFQECQWYTDYALKITENTEDLLLMNDLSFSLPCWGHLQCLLAYFWIEMGHWHKK